MSYEHAHLWFRYSPEGGLSGYGLNCFGGASGFKQESLDRNDMRTLHGTDLHKQIGRLS
jgi:hypothetical protein